MQLLCNQLTFSNEHQTHMSAIRYHCEIKSEQILNYYILIVKELWIALHSHENIHMRILALMPHVILFVQTSSRVAYCSSSHFFLKHIIIAKNPKYIIRNIILYEYSHIYVIIYILEWLIIHKVQRFVSYLAYFAVRF